MEVINEIRARYYARHDALVIPEQEDAERDEYRGEINQRLARQAVDARSARHDGCEFAFDPGYASRCRLGNLYGLLIDEAGSIW